MEISEERTVYSKRSTSVNAELRFYCILYVRRLFRNRMFHNEQMNFNRDAKNYEKEDFEIELRITKQKMSVNTEPIIIGMHEGDSENHP